VKQVKVLVLLDWAIYVPLQLKILIKLCNNDWRQLISSKLLVMSLVCPEITRIPQTVWNWHIYSI